MSRQRLRAILRSLDKIARHDIESQTTVHLLRDIADLHAMRIELNSLLLERLRKKPVLSPAEARLYRRMTGAGSR